MAGHSASRDRHGCKYGLWLGLGVFAARCLGGEYNRLCVMCRDATRTQRMYTLFCVCWVRAYVCMMLPTARCGERVPSLPGRRHRSDADYLRETRSCRGRLPSASQMCDPTSVISSDDRIFLYLVSLVEKHAFVSLPVLPERLTSTTCSSDRRIWKIILLGALSIVSRFSLTISRKCSCSRSVVSTTNDDSSRWGDFCRSQCGVLFFSISFTEN